MNRRLPLVIINPAAGGASAGRDWTGAAAALQHHIGPFECLFTHSSGDATHFAEEESRAGRRLLIAFGGDGTISEIANGIVRSGAPCELGILPHGTGSDFRRSLEIPSRLADAARVLRNGRSLRMDVGKVNYQVSEGNTDSRYFVNSASFGLSGEVAENTNRSSKTLGGMLSFASSTVEAAVKFAPPDVLLELEDEPARRIPVTTICLNNGRFFGGGMKIAPEASLVDGRLDVIVVEKLSVLEILSKGPLLYAGAHLGLPEVHHQRTRVARAWPRDSKVRIPLEVDGESPGTLPARFEVCPRALRVRVA